MKTFLIICALITVAVAQQPSVSCSYYSLGELYACYITINNPTGLNNFTEIGGIHLEGFTNSHVGLIYSVDSLSPNIPSIICSTFPNIEVLYLYNAGLTEITDNSLDGCSRITELLFIGNRISSISSNAFEDLRDVRHIDLEFNSLTTLPEDLFLNQQSLTDLIISYNPLDDVPAGLFRTLENLERVSMTNANLNEIDNQWFTNNDRLSELHLAYNRIALSGDSLLELNGLRILNLGNNAINEIPAGSFDELPNLQTLYLYGNNIRELQADSFENLGQLTYLDVNVNPLQVIQDGAFRGLVNLTMLEIGYSSLQQLTSNAFEHLASLEYISLNGNQIEELPQGVFASMPNLGYIGLWRNRLKTLRRNSFGTLSSIYTLELDDNIVNAFDMAIINDAVNLNTLYFSNNFCASGYFGNFQLSKDQHMLLLDRCFSNMRYIIDVVTDGDDEFSFFEGLHPGIAFRVNTDTEAHIALTPFEFLWNPVIEILIGTANNTRCVIRMNQETDVVTVPTPNVLTRNQWNDFRVTWANHNIMVFRGSDPFPFMTFTLQHFYPVNFYGLKAVETNASWTVQPFDW